MILWLGLSAELQKRANRANQLVLFFLASANFWEKHAKNRRKHAKTRENRRKTGAFLVLIFLGEKLVGANFYAFCNYVHYALCTVHCALCTMHCAGRCTHMSVVCNKWREVLSWPNTTHLSCITFVTPTSLSAWQKFGEHKRTVVTTAAVTLTGFKQSTDSRMLNTGRGFVFGFPSTSLFVEELQQRYYVQDNCGGGFTTAFRFRDARGSLFLLPGGAG